MKLYLGSAVRVANALIEVCSVVLPDGCMSSRTWVSHERLPEWRTAPISSIFLEHNMVSGVVSVLRRAHVTSRQATCISRLHCGGGWRIRTDITYYMRHSGWICRKNQEKDICADMHLYVPIRPSVFQAFDQRQKVYISFISHSKPHPTCQWDK